GLGKDGLDRLLIGDADGDLQRVEAAGLDGIASRRAVTAVADVTGETALLCRFERGDRVATAQHLLGAGVQLDEIDGVGPQPLEAALDGLQNARRAPVLVAPAAGMADLREQVELAAAAAHRATDQRLAAGIALRRVDHVQTGVERRVEEPGRDALTYAFVPDLAAAEAERGHVHVGAAETPALHQSSCGSVPARGSCEPPHA